MIAINASDGVLHVHAEIRIPSALAGHWSPARHAKLIELIRDYVEASELVDHAEQENHRDGQTNPQTTR